MLLLVALHVFANTVWIGAICAVGLLTAAASREAEASSSAVLATSAVSLYRRVATPAFALSFVAGLARLLEAPSAYMHLHWFHGKLTAALVVIALHHIVGAKAKRVAGGSRQAGKSSAILIGATLACAFVTVTFAVLKGVLVP